MKIFIATPFSSRVDADGRVCDDFRQLMVKLTDAIKAAGHEYFLALEHEGWRIADSSDAANELDNDFAKISNHDLMIVYLEDRVSAGRQLEMGYAQAKGKPIHIFQSGKVQWSNKTLGLIDGNSMTMVDGDEDFAAKAIEFVQSV